MSILHSVILVEGFHDRAFLGGWLESMGCESLKVGEGEKGFKGILTRGNGVHAFRTSTGGLVRVFPVGGKEKWPKSLKTLLEKQKTEDPSVAHFVINVDRDDEVASDPELVEFGKVLASISTHLYATGYSVSQKDGAFFVHEEEDYSSQVSPLVWFVDEEPRQGVPQKQTLERLVCSAMVESYPERAEPVEQWLNTRPAPPKNEKGKERAWSYLAGWHAEDGLERFYKSLWEDEKISKALLKRLEQNGSAEILNMIAGQ